MLLDITFQRISLRISNLSITPTVHFDAVVGERTAELRRRDSHPGKHTSGPVSPVSVGVIKVSSLYLLVCQSCCFELSYVHRRSSTSWRIVTSISLRTVFAHYMTSLTSIVKQKGIASVSVRDFRVSSFFHKVILYARNYGSS